jgi:hypothetical protein
MGCCHMGCVLNTWKMRMLTLRLHSPLHNTFLQKNGVASPQLVHLHPCMKDTSQSPTHTLMLCEHSWCTCTTP